MTRVGFCMRTVILFRTHYLYVRPHTSLRIYLLIDFFDYILDLLVPILTFASRGDIFLYAYLYALHVITVYLLFKQW
jgi:hypothetical protein